MTHTLTTGTWASVDAGCPLRCNVEGSDLANLMIGDDIQSIELLFDAVGMRRLAEVIVRAVAEMEARYEWESAERAVVGERGARDGARS